MLGRLSPGSSSLRSTMRRPLAGLTLAVDQFHAMDTTVFHEWLTLRAASLREAFGDAFRDLDGRDPDSLHLTLWKDGALIAGVRLTPGSEAVSLSRLCVAQGQRGLGVGQRLVRTAIAQSWADRPNKSIIVSAPATLGPFFQKFGMLTISPVYLDAAGARRIDMMMPERK